MTTLEAVKANHNHWRCHCCHRTVPTGTIHMRFNDCTDICDICIKKVMIEMNLMR